MFRPMAICSTAMALLALGAAPAAASPASLEAEARGMVVRLTGTALASDSAFLATNPWVAYTVVSANAWNISRAPYPPETLSETFETLGMAGIGTWLMLASPTFGLASVKQAFLLESAFLGVRTLEGWGLVRNGAPVLNPFDLPSLLKSR